MNKKEATQELSDFLDFNQSDIRKLSSINPELVNAFEKLFNAVSNEYGSGEMFMEIGNKFSLSDNETIFKSGDVVVFLPTKIPPPIYPEAGQIVEIQNDVTSNFEIDVKNNQAPIKLANQWVSIKKWNDPINPGNLKKSSDIKVMNEETGMPNIRMADPIEKSMWLNSRIGEAVMIERMFVPGDIVIVLTPGAKINSKSSSKPLLTYQIAKVTEDVSTFFSVNYKAAQITLKTQYVKITAGANSWIMQAINSVNDLPSIRLANTAEAALFDEEPVQEPGPPLVRFKLTVKTIPEQLEYDIYFNSNAGDRQSPTQSAGDLYRLYEKQRSVMKMLKDTAFEGNDKKYWGLISRKNPRSKQETFVWRKLVPQPKVVQTNVSAKTSPPKDLTLLSNQVLALKLKDVQDAIKFFEVQDPEYKELWDEMTRMQIEQANRV